MGKIPRGQSGTSRLTCAIITRAMPAPIAICRISERNAMKLAIPRRSLLRQLAAGVAGLAILPVAQAAKATVKKVLVRSEAPKGYDPHDHRWLMALDLNRCIGCGLWCGGL